MAIKCHKPEEIFAKLRQIEVFAEARRYRAWTSQQTFGGIKSPTPSWGGPPRGADPGENHDPGETQNPSPCGRGRN